MLAYYGTGRLWQPKRLTRGKLERTSRTIGYADCLDPGSSYKAFADWFRYWSTNALQVELKAAETKQPPQTREFADYIESVRRPINECLAPAGWKDVDFSHAREELVASHQNPPSNEVTRRLREYLDWVDADLWIENRKWEQRHRRQRPDEVPG